MDWRPQPGYPFRLIQADATTVDVQDLLSTVDAVHASPPCQRYSVMGQPGIDRSRYPDLIPVIRERLQAWGKPWVMENVPLAPLHDAKLVCGVSLGLRVIRHRLFETSWPYEPLPCTHLHGGNALGIYVSFYEGRRQPAGRKTPPHRKASQFRQAAGLTWMTTREMRQAIPPAYTEHIGRQLLDYIDSQSTVEGSAMAARDEQLDAFDIGMGADAPPKAVVPDPPVAPTSITGLNTMMASMGFPGADLQDPWDYQQPAN